MNYMFLTTAILVFLSSASLCYGAGVLPVDLLSGVKGESVTFTTTVKPTAQPFLALTWSFNGTTNIITSTSADVVGAGYENRITLDKSTGSLVLRNLTEKDSGEYELIIIPYGAGQIQGTAKLEVLTKVSKPTMACPTENVVEGITSLNLTCNSDGFTSRVWMKDGQPLVAGGRFSFHDGNRVLSISPVNRIDTGEFLCNVSNDISFDTARCRLLVYYGPDRPVIVQTPIGAELEESVFLSCSADSLPKATFFWKFKHMMMHGPVHYIHELEPSHLGRYTCTARNPTTGQEASVFHNLRGIVKESIAPPLKHTYCTHSTSSVKTLSTCLETAGDMKTSVILVIILGTISGLSHGAGVLPDNLIAAVGETVTFTTTVTPPATPFLIVVWSFSDIHGAHSSILTSSNTDIIDPAYANRVTLFRPTGSLELRNLTLSDNGEYTVMIIPNGGAQQKGICTLLILAPVSNVVVTPSSTDLVELSSSVRLSCSSSGSSPSFLWLNGSSEVTASDRVQLTDGGATLTIVSVTRYDQGPFRCQVSNPVSNGTSDPVNLSISYGPENINLKLSPSQEYYTEGSDIILTCSAVSRPPALFQWFLNADLLSNTGPELRLMNIQMNERGNYSCQAFNNKTLRYQISPPAAITVLAPISNVTVNASTTEILESSSSSVSLSCSASGSSPSFLWLNGSSEVTASVRVQLTDGGSTLTIVNMTRYDHGPFRCHVFNHFSNSTSDPVNLLIIYGPENINLTISPLQEFYDEGTDITLMCSADSGPPALIHWFLNGDLLSDTGPELRLVNIQKSQSGNYSCQAFNNRTRPMRNQTSQTAAISVLKSQISNVVVTPSATELLELSSVSMSCSTSGSFPTFLWLNDSSEVTASDRVLLTDGNSTLTIINVTRYDQGPFFCHVFNNFSNYTSDPVTLYISFGPENINLKLSPPQKYFKVGSNINMTCSADSRPAAQFMWFLNGSLLSDTGPEFRLMDSQMNHSGRYSCQAYNSKTLKYEKSKPAAISVRTPISNVMVTSNNSHLGLFEFNSSVRLSCSASGSYPSFLWLNGSSVVTKSDRVQLTDGGATLTLTRVPRYDQGPFSCNVSNGVSSEITQPVNLFIQHGPDNMAITGPSSVRVRDFTMLYCSTMSVPSPTFIWLYNGRPTNVREAAFVIKSIRPFDGGTFTCTAVNAVTGLSQSVSHELTVVDSLDCDCSSAAGRATIITAGCFLLIAVVGGTIVYGMIRRNRNSSDYPAHRQESLSMRNRRSDVYKLSVTAQNGLTSFDA
ncbi:hemicentin-1-like [Epinephelus lanceolatus]